jgi:formylglycine-generating enzyme required for sulfatase activity
MVSSRRANSLTFRAILLSLAFASAVFPATADSAKKANDGYGDLVYVPAGPFRMGDNFGDGEARELPVHTVDLDAFYIGKYEVTNGDFRKFRDDPGYDDPKFWPSGHVVPKTQIPYWAQAQNHGGGTPDSDNCPVIGVNWDAATAYCNWLSAKTGKKYRLPTEAEWEKAARGTDQRRFPWGNQVGREYFNYVGAQKYDTVQLAGFYDGSNVAMCKPKIPHPRTARMTWPAA